MKLKFLLPGLLLAASLGHAQLIEKKSITLSVAKKIVAVVEAEAKKNNVGGAVAVVDEGGNLVYLVRMDGTFAAGSTVSTGKAQTAAWFQRPTKVFEDAIKNGRTAFLGVELATPLQGGVPIVVDGKIIGAIGVSGAASADQDQEFAVKAAEAVGAILETEKMMMNTGVTYFEKNKVSSAFVKGMPLLENSEYKIHASHRDAAGMAEVHLRDTDIIYVLEGTATFVTGGTVVDGQTTATDEIRGKEIKDGVSRKLEKGDVIVVPAGTPHWFKEVKAPFNYYVVKSTHP